MKSNVFNSPLPFIIMFWATVGMGSGCASNAIKPYPGDETVSGPAQTLPYRVDGRVYYPMSHSFGFVQKGIASWYGPDFHGKLTSNGEVYNMNSLTAAHKTLPFGSVVRVTHRKTGKSVTVRINDRGPFVGDRVIDLSYDAAYKLGMIDTGTAPVSLRVIQGAHASQPRNAAGTSAQREVYSVQVGVFESLGSAQKMSRRFAESRILGVPQNGRKLYKVLVGRYSDYEKALDPMDDLRLRGFDGAFIVLSP